MISDIYIIYPSAEVRHWIWLMTGTLGFWKKESKKLRRYQINLIKPRRLDPVI